MGTVNIAISHNNTYTVLFNMFFLIILCGCFTLGSAQSYGMGPCPTGVQVQQDFELSKYTGLWKEITRIPMSIEKGWRCSTVSGTLKEDGTLETLNQGIYPDGSVQSITGDAKCGVEEAAKCDGHWNLDIFGIKWRPAAPYWVLETDYTSYSLAYSCIEYGGLVHAQMLWITSRTDTLDDATIQRLKQKAAGMGLKAGQMEMNDRTGC